MISGCMSHIATDCKTPTLQHGTWTVNEHLKTAGGEGVAQWSSSCLNEYGSGFYLEYHAF